MKNEIGLAKEDLEFIRSFFGNIEQDLYKDLWTCVLHVVYEAKDVTNSILVRDNCLLHLIYSFFSAIETIKLIKEEISNLPDEILKIGPHVVNSSNKPKTTHY